MILKQQQNGHPSGNETMNLTELVQMTFLNLQPSIAYSNPTVYIFIPTLSSSHLYAILCIHQPRMYFSAFTKDVQKYIAFNFFLHILVYISCVLKI